MTTEREKLEQGLWYDANFDAELLAERERAADRYFQFNQTPPSETEQREALLDQLLPRRGANVSIVAPFYTDYGYNCVIGDGSFLNVGCYLMDGAPITFGKNCFIGPSCGFYTANHPLIAEERNAGLEKAQPITLGDNVWLGGNVTVLPGVTIGSGSVIGAGSVVTKDIPAGVIAVGNPCRVVREIAEDDRVGR
ncbi:sugar O-acetyltransferase [Gulosibacter molinativorax]|uniref:Acetyltransferase n=1 Tax=Gulosibacter molinativorax TaxID=256821 RepID=A0ABT7C3Y9_9MICO|nr:sugar O-acetyltransferase [Gulosibacter molinativorax]MDJ1369936.1 sugar O-acetyltransferase [Gulosibacter molinativorax]QUY61906.1 Bacterial transferase hexapeptide repeat protein [Gulosibacter molinativorax]